MDGGFRFTQQIVQMQSDVVVGRLNGVGILDGTLLQEHFRHRSVVTQYGYIQGRQAIAVETVHIDIRTFEDRPGLLQVTVFNRSKQSVQMDINLRQFVQLGLGHFALLFGDFVLPVRSRVVMVVGIGRFQLTHCGRGQDVDPISVGEVFVIVSLYQASDPKVQCGLRTVVGFTIGRTGRKVPRFLDNLGRELPLRWWSWWLRSGWVLLVWQQVFHLFRLNRAEIR